MDYKNFPPTIITGVFNRFRPHSSEAFNGYRREINRGNSHGEFSLRLYEGDYSVGQVYTTIISSEDLNELHQTVLGNIYVLGVSVERPYEGKGLGVSLWVEGLKEISQQSSMFNDLVVDESGGWAMNRLPTVIDKMAENGFEAVESWRGEYRDMPATLISYSKK